MRVYIVFRVSPVRLSGEEVGGVIEEVFPTHEAAVEYIVDNLNSYREDIEDLDDSWNELATTENWKSVAAAKEILGTGRLEIIVKDVEMKVMRVALEVAWSHVSRSIEIAEGDEDPPEDIKTMREQLATIEAAQGMLTPP